MQKSRRHDWIKTLALIGAFVAVANWQGIAAVLAGAPEYDAARAGPVALYGTSWCGYCRKTRHYLKTHDIPFEEYDIEASESALRAFHRLGGRGVPVVTVGDQVIHGYSLNRLRKALECDHCDAGTSN